MTRVQEFRPDWVSPPGDTIVDLLRERGISEIEFANQIGRPLQEVTDLLEGRTTITIAVARRLAKVLGASVEFWMSRDIEYRLDVSRLHIAHKEWLDELPIVDMIRFGWISPVPHPSEETEACLNFFGQPSVQAWREAFANLQKMAIFRISASLDSRPGSVAAWLRQGEIEAMSLNCKRWDARLFKESLSGIRSLTRDKDPVRFIPRLQKLCSDCGVAIAVVRTPSGCPASGASRFLSKDKALLQFSFRYLTDDQFWFTFFHEAGHLLLHGDKGFFLEGVGDQFTSEEKQANEFAATSLIPEENQSELFRLRARAKDVIRFAVHVGVSPGIVVGQLQHYGRIGHNQLNMLKRRYKWDD